MISMLFASIEDRPAAPKRPCLASRMRWIEYLTSADESVLPLLNSMPLRSLIVHWVGVSWVSSSARPPLSPPTVSL
jgi:hypothetical protein